ncbi:MATE family efflux transporter [uncultured Allofournierella sp.]|uniref:MATE family efflux transporter n=1 Tax=uncultured Allofournierella sp. TaxID=1940258 RepID=UPI0037535586
MKNTIRVAGQEFSLLAMTWPVFVELLLQMLVGNIDQIMLSHYNQTAVAAVGNANQIMNTLILTFNVISLAATIMLSQYLGARELKKVEQIYTLALCLNLAISVVIALGLFVGADGLFGLMQVPAEARPEARSYLLITASTLPFQALMLTFSAFLRAHARMKVIMLSTGLINLINIVGNTMFIHGLGPVPQLGAAGAALSTSLCRVAGMTMVAIAFFCSVPGARLSFSCLRPFPTQLLKRFLGIGLPAGGEGLSYNLSQSASLVFVNMMGTYAVTTRMYTSMFAQVCYMLIAAVSQAAAIIVGYCIGAKEYDLADQVNKRVLRTFTPITLGLAVLLAVFAKPLFGLFSSDPQVIQLGQQVMLVDVVLELGRCFNIVLVRNLQAVGDVKFPVTIGILSQWLLGVAAAYLLAIPLGLGLVGIWLAFLLDENLRAIIFVIRWRKGGWRSIKTV